MGILLYQYGILTAEKGNASFYLIAQSLTPCVFELISKAINEAFMFDDFFLILILAGKCQTQNYRLKHKGQFSCFLYITLLSMQH